jgi:hypothetical protein
MNPNSLKNLKPVQKGEVRNPKGRPRKEYCLTSMIKSELDKIPPGEKQGRTWMELIVLAILKSVLKGNPAVIKEVWERLEGKVSQPLEHNVEGSKPLKIEVVSKEAKELTQELIKGG